MSLAARWRVKINRWLTGLGFPSDWYMVPLAAVIGVLAGLVAAGFHYMVHGAEHLFYHGLGHIHFPGSRWLWVLSLPVIGGILVGLIQRYIVGRPSGHGIPDVIEAMARRHGKLPPMSGPIKAVTASLTIGSGGSAGVEGPIVHIGSVLGSTVGQVLRVSHDRMHTLIGCGAAGGLAAIFNAPIAGVIFVLEVVLRDFSSRTFLPIVIASVFGTAVAQAILGQDAIFGVTEALQRYEFTLGEMGFYAVLGILCGLCGAAFTTVLHQAEQRWSALKLPWGSKPAFGGLTLGILGLIFLAIFHNAPATEQALPPFYANGYRFITTLLSPQWYDQAAATGSVITALLPFLAMALVCKIVGTSLTLGSGGAGGIFAPSLFMGATLGAMFGVLVQGVSSDASLTPATYALAGMAGVLSGSVHCPLTAFLLVFEITRDYKVILPVMLVAILATLVSQVLLRDNIYTLALRRQGIRIGTMSDLSILRRLRVADVPLAPAVLVHPEDPAQRLIDLAEKYQVVDYVVADEKDQYEGMVVGQDVRTTLLQREAIPLMIVGELMRSDLATAIRDETLDVVLDKFSQHDVSSLAVIDDERRVVGMITRSRLMRQYQHMLESRA